MGRSNQNSQAEKNIGILKKELTKIAASTVPNLRTNWPKILPNVVNNINAQCTRGSTLSRKQLHFSPLVYSNTSLQLDITGEKPEIIADIHYYNLKRLKHIRQKALKQRVGKENTLKRFPLLVGKILKVRKSEERQKNPK